MESDAPKPEPKASRVGPPTGPPSRTAIGLDPGNDGGKKYRFTIAGGAFGERKFIRESAGRRHYGHVIIRVEPNAKGGGVIINSEASDDTIPQQYVKPAIEGMRLALDEGCADGPVVDVIVRIVGGSWDKIASNDLAFKMAGIFAIKDAVKKAGPIPIE
jgi:elongation factor G